MTKIIKPYPTFAEEKKLWRKDFVVVGVDEVGRGSWAGPVVASAVAFGVGASRSPALSEIIKLGINDSKALSSRKREQLAEIIKECSIWSVAEMGVGIINKVGIGKATECAMRKSIAKLISNIKIKNPKQIQNSNVQKLKLAKTFVLVDAFHIRYLRGIGLRNQKAIIHGDQKLISIAAASILAKVYRDNLMKKLAKGRDIYGWARNKGYGTKEHQQAILSYGLTRLHRKQFVAKFLVLTSLYLVKNSRGASRRT